MGPARGACPAQVRRRRTTSEGRALDRTALVVGVTGIAGYNSATALVDAGFRVVGLSRSDRYRVPGVEHVHADVLEPGSIAAAVRDRRITDLVFATWQRRPTEAGNIEVNGAMLQNTLDVLGRTSALRHVALVTGLKHYLGPFEAYAAAPVDTPFREDTPRLPVENFYYTQEDILLAAAQRHGFSWSVHRPHTMIGFALGNAMNMGVTLAVYGHLCRATGEPFAFPGSPEQYNGVTDVTDARMLGRQVVWAATEPAARDRAYNIVNGGVFRWRWLWPRLADALGVDAADYPGHADPLEHRLAHADDVWAKLVAEHDLAPHRATELASWWHTDADLGRTVETFADMSRSRGRGFPAYQDTVESFLDLFAALREHRIIPPRCRP